LGGTRTRFGAGNLGILHKDAHLLRPPRTGGTALYGATSSAAAMEMEATTGQRQDCENKIGFFFAPERVRTGSGANQSRRNQSGETGGDGI
uniref:Uncharacterized protein n=1 Tax=Triticum urartu TaxID=4572 RepID=A0A8R7QDF2_TRIUA